MKKTLAALLAVASCMAQAQTVEVPTATTIVSTLSASAPPRDGFTRLRLSLTSNDVSSEESMRIAGVAVCTTSVCYESGAPSAVTISSTAKGTGTIIAELEVPYSNIASVRFKSALGKGFLQGSVALAEPLKLEKDFQGGDILVVVQKRVVSYVPISAASNYVQPEGTTVFYNPQFATTVSLPQGVTLSIPAGATGTPQVFLVGVHDTGDDYPLVDIYPPVQLARPASVQLPVVVRDSLSALSRQATATPRAQAVLPGRTFASQPQAVRAITPLNVEINATGAVPRTPQGVRSNKQSSGDTADATPLANAGGGSGTSAICNSTGWCNCADEIAYPPNQQNISNGTAASGTTYLDWCTTIPPYVHITVTNMADARERFTIKHSPKVGVSVPPQYSPPRLPLMRITSWSPYTQVMTNGFYWDGDYGLVSGGFGLADGHVHNFATGLGDNLARHGACQDWPSPPYDPCNKNTPHGNKRVMLMPATGTGWSWVDNASAGVISNSMSYVSSSTSIVRNGVCAADATVNRWSAVGTTSSGQLVLMSSTTDGQTSAAELCAVFLAMGAVDAIRLDGGPSAAMTVDGALKNPLGGANFIKYGTMRYIAYGLKVSYPGW